MKTRVEVPAKMMPFWSPSRYKIAYGGRGAAKSMNIARMLLTLGAQRERRILCGRETQNSIKESVHQLLCDQIKALNLSSFYDPGETVINGRNGTVFGFVGLRQQNINKIRSWEGADICWVEEGQAVTKKSWSILVPTIRKEDSEIWCSFNPELDTDETYTRFVTDDTRDDAVVIEMNWRDNPWFPDVLEKERLDLKRRDPVEYQYVWEGKCRTAVEGAIYANEIEQMHREKRFTRVPYDPLLKVHTIWDLGWNDAMTIIFAQRSGSEVRCIDYIEDSHRTLDSYVEDIKDRKYNWGTDWLPHDGATHNFQTGMSTEKRLRNMGRNVKVIEQDSIEEGIRAARMLFPRTWFDRVKCAPLVDALKRYRRNIPTTTNEPSQPVHDGASHGSDAYRGLAMIVDQLSNSTEGKRLKGFDRVETGRML
jgi:phage terminase large subunit